MFMKKLLRIPLLFVAMLLSSIPISAHDFEVDGIYYNFIWEAGEDGSDIPFAQVTFSGKSWYSVDNEYSGDIVIPESVIYNGNTIPVTSIRERAFYECTGLTSVTIPNSVTTIGGYAFYECTGLTSVTIGNSVTTIGKNAFYCCTGLTSVTIGNSVTTIGESAFSSCTGLTSVTIPNSVTTIGEWAFSYCISLTSVTIPNSVTSIGTGVFSNCTGLTSVIIPNSVTTIGVNAFYYCSGLTSITIPNSVTNIAYQAVFLGCSNLESIEVESGNAVYDSRDNCNAIIETSSNTLILGCKNTVIPNSVTSIREQAFYECAGLTSVTIGNSVTSIGEGAFYGCTGLSSVTIPNSVTSISNSAFNGCANLKEILAEAGNPVYFSYDGVLYSINTLGEKYLHILPPTLTEYVAPPFLTELTIPNMKSVIISEGSNLKSVKVNDCSLLENLEIKEPLDTIIFDGDDLYDAVNLKKLILPKKIKNKYSAIRLYTYKNEKGYLAYTYTYTFHSLEFLQIPNLSLFSYIKSYEDTDGYDDDFVFENGTSYGSYSTGTSGNDYYKYSLYLPSSLKKLILTDQSEFYNEQNNCWYIFNNTLKDGFEIELLKPVSNLENTTIFQNSAITKITLDATEIPIELFAGCANLKSLTLPFAGVGTVQTPSNFGELFGTTKNDNMRAVTQFFEDGTNKTYYLPTGLEELVLTEGCEMIPYGGLYNCNMLKKLTLPTTLFMIGEKALYGCAKMTDIYCKGADPAVAYDNSFDGMRLTSCKLHVPYNTSDRYKMSTGWEKFYYVEEEAPLMVSVAKSIENAGVVYGINEYQPGQTAEMEAVAHSGYTFEGWYEAGVLLTTDSKYTFTVIDSHNLVASFLPVLDENEVTVTPKAEDVTLSWASVAGASAYVVEIFEDADMVVSAGIVTIDQAGQVVPMSSSVTTTITNLTSTYDYYYKVTAFNVENVVLSQFTGSFTPLESGIEDVEYDNDINYSILPGLLNIDGYGHVLVADIKGNILYNGDVEGNLTLNIEKGIYILKTDVNVYKIAIK